MTETMKVGDVIAIQARYVGWSLQTITRVTPTMYVTDGYRFRRDLGIVGAASFGPFRGMKLTPEIECAYRIEQAKRKLDRFVITEANLEAVEALLEGLKA